MFQGEIVPGFCFHSMQGVAFIMIPLFVNKPQGTLNPGQLYLQSSKNDVWENENNSIPVTLIAKLPGSPQSVLRESNIC